MKILILSLLLVSTLNFKITANSKSDSFLLSNSEPASTEDDALKNDTSKEGTNVVGKKDEKVRVTESLTINKCDQILEIESETLSDPLDFKVKQKKFFLLNMYNIIEFGSKDIKTFEKLIHYTEIQQVPHIIDGSIGCVKFQSLENDIVICLKDKVEAQNLLDAYASFMKCRAGDNLKKVLAKPADKFKTYLKKSCMGLDINFDEKKFKSQAEMEIALNSAIETALTNISKNYDKFLIKEVKNKTK